MNRLLASAVLFIAPLLAKAQFVTHDRLLSFEDKNVPSYVSCTASEASVSGDHFREGTHSLRWDYRPGAVLEVNRDLGFEPITGHDDEIVDIIKHTINSHIAEGDSCRFNLSACIEKNLPVSYDTASRIFSQIEGRTIEKYYNACKIERVKELLGYGNMTLGDIAFETGYSSTAHLSRRFKEVTGMTPTEYLKSGITRKGINEI